MNLKVEELKQLIPSSGMAEGSGNLNPSLKIPNAQSMPPKGLGNIQQAERPVGNPTANPLNGTAYHGPLSYHPAVGLHYPAISPISPMPLKPEMPTR